MPNRICVMIDERFIAVNPKDELICFTTQKPERIGDDAIAMFKSKEGNVEKVVRYLKSEGHTKDSTYLVDLSMDEAWEWSK